MTTANEMIMTATGTYKTVAACTAEGIRYEIAELVRDARAVPPAFRTGGAAAADAVRARIYGEIAALRAELAAVAS